MRFWLGTHKAVWLERAGVGLMVSHRTLRDRASLPRAIAPWVLDSGGFTELNLHGRWTVEPQAYIDAARRYQAEVGMLTWAAPQDWMCEPFVLQRTGLTVDRHLGLTVDNFCELRAAAPDVPFIPVLQGFTLEEYQGCVERYRAAGVDLHTEPVVGIGSVCRRQATIEAARILHTLGGDGLRLHGFGLKLTAIDNARTVLESADSMAWSFDARHEAPLEGCPHKSCANCMRYALRWRAKVEERIAMEQLAELSLFA